MVNPRHQLISITHTLSHRTHLTSLYQSLIFPTFFKINSPHPFHGTCRTSCSTTDQRKMAENLKTSDLNSFRISPTSVTRLLTSASNTFLKPHGKNCRGGHRYFMVSFPPMFISLLVPPLVRGAQAIVYF